MCVTEGKQLITSPIEISNSFNSYYMNIADNILKKRQYEGDNCYKKYMHPPHQNSMYFNPVDTDEIKQLIQSFNVNKSTGPCSISPKVLNVTVWHILYPK